jgi:hypothetical protein
MTVNKLESKLFSDRGIESPFGRLVRLGFCKNSVLLFVPVAFFFSSAFVMLLLAFS